MKRHMKKYALILTAFTTLFVSCQSAINFTETAESLNVNNGSQNIPDMEFIGFKADYNALGKESIDGWSLTKKSPGIKNLGAKLQMGGIAVDESYAYFGIYSFQELEAFKNKKRYITFVEVSEYKLATLDKSIGRKAAGLVLLCTGILAPIGGIMYCAPTTTELHLQGVFNIYVFDTTTRTIKYKDAVSIDKKNDAKGEWYLTPDQEKEKIYDYYGTIVSNEILQKYSSIHNSPSYHYN